MSGEPLDAAVTVIRGRVGEARIFDAADGLAGAAAQWVGAGLREAVERSGEASLVLAGGGTPLPTYRRLRAAESIPWPEISVYWGDERCVPPSDPESNYGAARRELLGGVDVTAERVHRIHGELGPTAAAAEYEARLREHFAGDRPRFDLVLSGVGDDGHTASLFPGAIESTAAWVVPARAPEPPRERVSLTLGALAASRRIAFLVAGRGKSEIVGRIFDGATELPAAQLAIASAAPLWFLDRAAASGLGLDRG